jgi:Protein of unknown function (DUF3244).
MAKTFSLLLMLLLLGTFTSSADEIDLQRNGETLWGDNDVDLRSLKPTIPVAHINNNEITIVFGGIEADLKVTITTLSGEIVYNNDYFAPFTLNIEEGTSMPLKITITHPVFGYVQGEFTLE